MSFKVTAWAVKQKVNFPATKLVLILMAGYADDNGVCWPSQTCIANAAQMSRRSIIRHINALVEGGFLTKESRFDAEKGQMSNIYRILNSAEIDEEPCEAVSQPPVTKEANPSETVSQAPVTPCHNPSDTVSHKSIIEPIIDNIPPIIPQKPKPARKRKADTVVAYTPEFEAFWAAYPKRQGGNPKFEAWNSYSRLISAGVTHDAIMAGTLAYAAQVDDPRYVAQAVTFLNQRRFEDDYKPVAAKKVRIGGGFC